ncbi:MAG: hypothetical protein LCI00_23090 [Chloroflexi bacterium]|nr:hypothetical protein [Chloroflexota bacterium]MCC6895940.1 hypothetical protein [Anaerolineae bacterium]
MNLWNRLLKCAEKVGIDDDLIYVAFRGDLVASQSLIEKLKSLSSTERWREALIDRFIDNINYDDTERASVLLELLVDFPSDYVRSGAFYNLGVFLGDKRALTYFQKLSEHADGLTAFNARLAIKKLTSN